MKIDRLPRWYWLTAIAIVTVFVFVRLMLAGWVINYLNARLDKMGDYHGHLDAVELHLWRGAYSIDGLRVEKRTGKLPVPLLNAPRADISVSWDALLHGAVVARVSFAGPELNFVDVPGNGGDQNGRGVDWRHQLESLLPLRMDEVQVHDGRVHFRNYASNPAVDMQATSVEGVVRNLSNARKASDRAASFDLTGRILGNAPMTAKGDFDPLGSVRDFSVSTKVSDIDLRKANDFLQAYAKLDVEKGTGDFVMELKSRNGMLDGYAKPLFHGVQIFSWKHDVEEQHDNPLRAAWEAAAGGIQNLFKNHGEDQFATRVEIHGSVENKDVSAWEAVTGVLRNAFVQAFKPTFERLPEKRD